MKVNVKYATRSQPDNSVSGERGATFHCLCICTSYVYIKYLDEYPVFPQLFIKISAEASEQWPRQAQKRTQITNKNPK